jgi:hypothetical protein
MLKRIDPDPTSGIGKDFAQRKEFYSALFVPPRWHLAQKITSNDGNVIYIFRREAQPSFAAKHSHPKSGMSTILAAAARSETVSKSQTVTN